MHRQDNDPKTKTQTMAHKTCGNHRVWHQDMKISLHSKSKEDFK